jgi:hypothetical protein
MAIAPAAGPGAITDGTGGATPTADTQVGVSASAGSDDRAGAPPSMLARLAREVSDARRNAACDSAIVR